jgi:hypothetical protein
MRGGGGKVEYAGPMILARYDLARRRTLLAAGFAEWRNATG